MQGSRKEQEVGFSLVELMIAMAIILVVMGISVMMIAGAFNTRSRENQRSDALADAQRALSIMSREIANSGFGLTNNGVIAADSGVNSIRVRANLNAYSGGGYNNATTDPDEDVKYFMYTGGATNALVRYDVNTATASVLANRLDSLNIHYYNAKVDYTTANCDIITSGVTEVAPDAAQYIVFTVCVQLPSVGTPGAPGYQPASKVQLTSDVTLRNSSSATLDQY